MKRLILPFISLIVISCNPIKSDYLKESTSQIADSAKIPLIQVAFRNKSDFTSFILSQNDTIGTAAGKNTVFQAASLSKPLFSYIVLLLSDRGIIDLDRPLSEYTTIERFENKEWASLITARMVMSHRTGLPNWASSPSSEEWPSSVISFKFRPDSAFSYSGEGYYLLQRAVEELSGKSLEQIAADEIFKPLGMTHSSYEWREEYDSLAADGYNREGINRGKGRYPRANTAYTLRTTASDYSKFLDLLMSGEGLKPETHKEMISPLTAAVRYAGKPRECDKDIFWGLGVGIETDTDYGNIIFHWGDNGNFKALFVIVPDKKSHLVYFTNSARGHDIIDQIMDIFFSPPHMFSIGSWVNLPEPE
jgi:CubicO group peptidase (beta-lactamase class C family)